MAFNHHLCILSETTHCIIFHTISNGSLMFKEAKTLVFDRIL